MKFGASVPCGGSNYWLAVFSELIAVAPKMSIRPHFPLRDLASLISAQKDTSAYQVEIIL